MFVLSNDTIYNLDRKFAKQVTTGLPSAYDGFVTMFPTSIGEVCLVKPDRVVILNGTDVSTIWAPPALEVQRVVAVTSIMQNKFLMLYLLIDSQYCERIVLPISLAPGMI